jgi:hypothetical protein
LGFPFISWAAKLKDLIHRIVSQSVGVAAKCVIGKRKEGRKREREREERRNTTHISCTHTHTHTHPNTCKEKRVNNNHAKSAQM